MFVPFYNLFLTVQRWRNKNICFILLQNICLVFVISRCFLDADKSAKLDQLLNTLQQRWGNAALQPLSHLSSGMERSGIRTGFAALDQALGGIPPGCIVELVGKPTSGMTTLAHKIIQQSQGDAGYAVYVDLESTFDPDYATRCGVNLDRLFLIRPQTEAEALDIARDLLTGSSTGIMILDLGKTQPEPRLLHRLTRSIAKSGYIVLVLVVLLDRGDLKAMSTPATIRLLIERRGWLMQRHDIQGYRAAVTILKSSVPPQNPHIDIDIRFDGVVKGDPM
jgi:hypothetical protein